MASRLDNGLQGMPILLGDQPCGYNGSGYHVIISCQEYTVKYTYVESALVHGGQTYIHLA